MKISKEEFDKIEIVVGTIIDADKQDGIRNSAYKLTIDFGDQGIKLSSAQLTKLYTLKELTGKQVVAVINFPPKQIGHFFSECLVLGVMQDNGGVVLLQPERKVINGLHIG